MSDRRAFGVLFALAIPTGAWAQTRICAQPTADWVADLDVIEIALASGDVKEARVLVDVMDREWECMVEPVPTSQLVRYMRFRAWLAFSAQDADEWLRWEHAAGFADPGAAWPAWVPTDHPVRQEDEPAPVVALEGRYLAPPKKGGIWIDGRLATAAEGPAETPVFVQAYGDDGVQVLSAWQDGPSFPAALLGDTPSEIVAPKWWVPSTATGAVIVAVPVAGATAPVSPAPVAAEPIAAEPAPEPVAAEPVAARPVAAAPAPVPVEPEPPLPTDPMPRPVKVRLRNGALIAAGTGLALYGTSWALRGAWNADPDDGLYYATNATYVASITAGVTAGGLLVGALVVSDR